MGAATDHPRDTVRRRIRRRDRKAVRQEYVRQAVEGWRLARVDLALGKLARRELRRRTGLRAGRVVEVYGNERSEQHMPGWLTGPSSFTTPDSARFMVALEVDGELVTAELTPVDTTAPRVPDMMVRDYDVAFRALDDELDRLVSRL